MANKLGVPLTDIPDFPTAAIDHLAGLWITTAEEVMSAASQSNGRDSLATLLDLPATGVAALVSAAEAVVPEDLPFDDENVPVALGAMPVAEVASAEDEPLAFADLPASIDLHAQLPPVRNQGDRGTCVAHVVAAVREFLLGDQSTDADLSEQFIYWACKERDGYPDVGTWIKTGMDVLQELGVCPEPVWPYDAAIIAGNEGHGPPPANAASEATPFRVTGFTALNARWIDSLREALANGSPVAVSMDVYQSCQRPYTYRMGDIRLPLPGEVKLGGHAMLLVGYVDDEEVPGGGYFIVRNSWGEAFGYDGEVAPGYCRLPYAYLRQYGIEAFTAELA